MPTWIWIALAVVSTLLLGPLGLILVLLIWAGVRHIG